MMRLPMASLLLIPLSLLLVCEPVQSSNNENEICHASLTVPLDTEKIRRFENGSLVHEGVLYPSGLHWSTEDDSVYGCICEIMPCMRKCCQDGLVISSHNATQCVNASADGKSTLDLRLPKDQLVPEIRDINAVADRFALVRNNVCPNKSYILEPDKFEEDKFTLAADGALRLKDRMVPQWLYCMDWHESSEEIAIVVCISSEIETWNAAETLYRYGMLLSMPFLLLTFLVYAIIPELRNIYGKTVMCYVASLISAYTFTGITDFYHFMPIACITIAFVIHYSFLASFFWLNVMCFDIWWTFGGFRSLQGTAKQRERKKFIIYSIYAWGSASLLTGVCFIMDFVPSVPKTFIRPEFGVDSCWFYTNAARAIYFYGPMSVTVFCNICLFISTAFKIVQHKKDTAHHLKGSESRRHDDNKQWFNLYLKLFIVMGINWSMEIISWLFNGRLQYLWYITDLTNTLQGVIIFVIFVWKDKIKRMLLKRFRCPGTSVLSRNSTRSIYHSSTSRTGATTATHFQENVDLYVRPNASYRIKNNVDDSDCT